MTFRFGVWILATIAVVCSAGCSASPQTNKSVAPKLAVDTILHAPKPQEYAPNLGLAFSAGGFGTWPPDAIGIDSSRSMGFETRSKDANGAWHSLKGFAVIEGADYDQFVKIVTEGKLLDLDPTAVLGQCPKGELYTLSLTSSRLPRALHLEYSSCALDYNLLSEPQRSHFVQLNVWLDSLRVHYRPKLPN